MRGEEASECADRILRRRLARLQALGLNLGGSQVLMKLVAKTRVQPTDEHMLGKVGRCGGLPIDRRCFT